MVSIIIVNYNCGELLRRCLASIRASVTVPFEVIVVDNASSDRSLEDLPEMANLTVVREPSNLGFSKASNIGAAVAKGEVLHFLNPDTEVFTDINESYRLAMKDTGTIFVTSIFDSQSGGEGSDHPFPTIKNLLLMVFAPNKVARWYLGASIIVGREVFNKLGKFSEDYFMYCEDVELFYQAYLAGVKTVKTPSKVTHHQGGASRQVWTRQQRFDRCEYSGAIFARKFGLRFDYFVFKHVAFLCFVWRNPSESIMEILSYWRVQLGIVSFR